MPHVHAFITSDLGLEVGLTALARFLLPKGVVIRLNIKMADIRGGISHVLEKLAAELAALNIRELAELASLNLCGDFWSPKDIELARSQFPGLVIHNYWFDGASTQWGADGCQASKDTCAPSEFIIARARSVLGESSLLQYALAQNARALALLDARCRGKNVSETQPFVAGLCNIQLDLQTADAPLDLEDRFFQLLSGRIALDEVLKIGTSIVRSQQEVARERALKNARKGGLKNGETYVITGGQEYVNVTHEELHRAHPNAKITIVASLKFADDQPDVVAHSMRSWVPDVDVKAIIGPHGGGAPSSAGARRGINILVDY